MMIPKLNHKDVVNLFQAGNKLDLQARHCVTESCPWASLPHFYSRLHKQSFPSAQPCDQIWWRNDKCPLSIHKSWTYYSPSSSFARTQARIHAYTHLKCASAASACRAPCSLNLAVVKVHRRWSLTSHARFVIDRGSLSSDLRQRIRGITSFEWFDATRPGSVLLYASALWWDAACRLGASFTTLHELSAVCKRTLMGFPAESLPCLVKKSHIVTTARTISRTVK